MLLEIMNADVQLVIQIIPTSVVVLLCYYVFHKLREHFGFKNKLNKLPGPKTWPFVGNLIQTGAFSSAMKHYNPQIVFKQHRRALCRMYYKEKIMRLWVGPNPFVYFLHPDSAQVLLTSNTQVEKNVTYSLTSRLFGQSTFLITGDLWRKQRRNLTPAFHFRIVQDFVKVVNYHSAKFVKHLRTLCDNEWIDIVPVLTMCTLDVFSESSFGVSLESHQEEKMSCFNNVRRFLKFLGLRANLPWLAPNFIFDNTADGKENAETIQSLRKFAAQIIARRREILANNEKERQQKQPEIEENDDEKENIYFLGKKKRLGSLDLLLNLAAKGENSEEMILDEISSLMIAGHDTTKSNLSMSLYLIGLHTNVQDKIVEELNSLYGDDREQPVTYEDLTKLKYTECAIKESLRLYSSVPIIGRKLNEDVTVEGHTIPKGTQCIIPIQEIHRNPVDFPNPDIFDPERFLPENCTKRHPYSYIPFSAGPRNCIGQRFAIVEEKMIIAWILRHFKIQSLDPVEKIFDLPELIMSVDGPIRIKFTPRV